VLEAMAMDKNWWKRDVELETRRKLFWGCSPTMTNQAKWYQTTFFFLEIPQRYE
jgi:hypothetical protein